MPRHTKPPSLNESQSVMMRCWGTLSSISRRAPRWPFLRRITTYQVPGIRKGIPTGHDQGTKRRLLILLIRLLLLPLLLHLPFLPPPPPLPVVHHHHHHHHHRFYYSYCRNNCRVRNQQRTPYRIPLIFPQLQNNADPKKVNPPSAKAPTICSTFGCPGLFTKDKTDISCIGLWSVPNRRSKGKERESHKKEGMKETKKSKVRRKEGRKDGKKNTEPSMNPLSCKWYTTSHTNHHLKYRNPLPSCVSYDIFIPCRTPLHTYL